MRSSFMERFLRMLIPRNEVAWSIAKRFLNDSQVEVLRSVRKYTESVKNQDLAIEECTQTIE